MIVNSFAIQLGASRGFVNYADLSGTPQELLIIESRSKNMGNPGLTNTDIANLQNNEGKSLFGYTNIAVTDTSRTYWNNAWTTTGDDLAPLTAAGTAVSWLNGSASNAFGRIANFRDPAWQQIVVNEAREVLAQGLKGVYFDDFGAYFVDTPFPAQNQQNARDMIDALSNIVTAIRNGTNLAGPNTGQVAYANAKFITNGNPFAVTDAGLGAYLQKFTSSVDAMLLDNLWWNSNKVVDLGALNAAASNILPYMPVLALESDFNSGFPRNLTDGERATFIENATALGLVPYIDAADYRSITRNDGIPADNFIVGGNAGDILQGTAVRDQMWGMAGFDNLQGGGGNDTLNGGSGSDTMAGGEGDDVVYFDTADAFGNVTGGNGFDILYVVGGSAPTGFNLAAQGFERAYHQQTDTTNQSWSSIRDIYAASWARVQSNIVFDNGARQDRNFDFANNQIYSEYIDYYLDLAFPNTVTRQFILEDAGTKQERMFDYQGNQTYTEYVNYYGDAAISGSVTRQVIVNDNGTKQERIFDYLNNQPAYREYINFYDAAGAVKRQVGINDAGGVAWEYFY